MCVRKSLAGAALVALASVAAPRAASADWFVTPFVGWNLGGSADVTGNGGPRFSNKFEKKLDYGVSLGSLGAGALGFELDLGYSPNFFETGTASNNQFEFTNRSNVTTLMGNVLVAAPVGGRRARDGGRGRSIRPYAVGGVGLLRTNVQDVSRFFSITTKNDFGLDVGGGLMAFLSRNAGLRGDIRFFRGFRGTADNATGLALSNFKFWRGSVGVTFKF